MKTFVPIVMLWHLITTDANTYGVTDKLQASLLKGYNQDLRPRWNQQDTVDVYMSINYFSVLDLDVAKETLTTDIWAFYLWKDDILTWNTSAHGDIEGFRVSPTKVWTPDVVVQNPIETSIVTSGSRVYALHTGLFRIDVEYHTETSCVTSVTKFPFDEHTCEILFSSDTYVAGELNISTVKVRYPFISKSSQWNVVGGGSEKEKGDKKKQSFVKLLVTVKRQPVYFVVNLLLPILVISTLSPCVFLVKSETGEKLSISVTLFLSFTFFITLLNGMLPQTSSSTSLISLYVCVQLHLSGLYIVLCIVIQRVSLMKEHNTITSRIARFTCVPSKVAVTPLIVKPDVDAPEVTPEMRIPGPTEVADKLDKLFFMFFFVVSGTLTAGYSVFVAL
ncbi:acetylcholine receptor subunit delta-like [Haliotis cracherodii]|uniref:acetylcholine receptor subunit delta-like n=1 Tax=Haliotis cracherodii TaxID=6455 RepID=UPI0039E8B10F